MLKEYSNIFRRILIFTDICIGVASFYIGYYLRDKLDSISLPGSYTNILVLFILIWAGLLYFLGLYESFRVKQLSDMLLTIWASAFIGIGVFGSVAYLMKIEGISRILVIAIFIIAAILMSLEKLGIVLFLRSIRKKGYNVRNVLMIGTGKRAQNFITTLESHNEWGLKIIGLIDKEESYIGKDFCGYKVMGSFKDIPDIVHNNVVDEVIFIVPHSWFEGVEEVMKFLKSEGVKVHFAVNYFEMQFSKAKQTDLDGFPMLTFETAPHKLSHLLLKRVMDLVLSGIGLVVLSPVFLVISVIIKFTSPGPIFFSQTRSGVSGRKFKVYKFRTMVVDAENKLHELMSKNEMQGPVFKIKDDPRITKIGKFLRKTSLDELPQLWNVFKGDMSLVGPRPPLPSEVEKYESWQRRRLSMRPGITCIWQISGRNQIKDFNKWMELDLKYIDNWSLFLDFKILLLTVPVVLFGIGAE